MNMLVTWIETIGNAVITRLRSATALANFGWRLLVVVLNPRTYDSATRWIITKQIYFTAVQALPIFIAYSLVISAVIIRIMVTVARNFGLSEYVPGLIVGFLVMELLPFLSVLFVALRSGAAINTEIALMHVNNELAAFEHARIDPIRYEFMPRVVGGVLSVLALTGLSGLTALGVAFFVIYGLHPVNFPAYARAIGQLLAFPLMFWLVLKTTLFGLCVTLIPLKTGLEIPRRLFLVPVAVLKGMMRVFFAIVLIEVASLAFKYI
ncbi:ABC transporter permease [Sulfuriferula plumbiphila]|uniref:ABC transporter permease n=2 Tax=Sulfuriferula plumbiphila TaxID=171865 RepID=A0A512LC69_9PROT|nr:ABC transporter permease [Sulfuriferula plumbiphila]GEP32083.1 ABC transporter permease [Sulfuriferula plumbiphila]